VNPSVVFEIESALFSENLMQWEAADVPGWLTPDDDDDARRCPHRLQGEPPFKLTSVGRRSSGKWFYCNCGSLSPAVEVVGVLVPFSASSIFFRCPLLYLQNYPLGGVAVLAVSDLAAH
jgi:hypothetical protein